MEGNLQTKQIQFLGKIGIVTFKGIKIAFANTHFSSTSNQSTLLNEK
jgi:hypothetical protein